MIPVRTGSRAGVRAAARSARSTARSAAKPRLPNQGSRAALSSTWRAAAVPQLQVQGYVNERRSTPAPAGSRLFAKRAMSSFKDEYDEHVAERAAETLPPLALNAEQVRRDDPQPGFPPSFSASSPNSAAFANRTLGPRGSLPARRRALAAACCSPMPPQTHQHPPNPTANARHHDARTRTAPPSPHRRLIITPPSPHRRPPPPPPPPPPHPTPPRYVTFR